MGIGDRKVTVKEVATLLAPLATAIGMGYVALYRLGEVEAHVRRTDDALEEKAAKTDVEALSSRIESIQISVGRVQTDVAKMCVATLGIEKCSTTGGDK